MAFLILVAPTHVDDLKVPAPTGTAQLSSSLWMKFGKLTQDLHEFTHIGIAHKQDTKNFEVELHQHAYAQQLRQICKDEIASKPADTEVQQDLKSCFATLLGGLAWMMLTCPAIAVYVGFLQRHLQRPTLQHLRSLNRLVAWIKSHPQSLR